MPIDFDALRKKKEQEVQDMLTGQMVNPVPSPVRRSPLIDNLSRLPGVSLDQSSLQGSIAAKTPEFNRRSAEVTAKAKFQRQRQLDELMFQNAVERAKEAGLREQDAIAFGRKVLQNRKQQEFEAQQAQKERESLIRRDRLADEYANRGVALEDRFQPSYDPTGAILRLLIGTGATIGTAYGLNKMSNSGNNSNVSIPNISGTGSSLREKSGFVRRSL